MNITLDIPASSPLCDKPRVGLEMGLAHRCIFQQNIAYDHASGVPRTN